MAISDLHRSRDAAKAVVERITSENPDAILVAGDISHGNFEEAIEILWILGALKMPVFFVPGNMDSPRLSEWNIDNLRNLHGRCERFEDYAFVGLGGAVYTSFNTLFEFNEMEIYHVLDQAYSNCRKEKMVLLSHCPPRDKLDRTKMGIHAGSYSVKHFIEKRRPALVVCGHIHEAQGIDNLGGTILVNPGPAYTGGYARIQLNSKVQVILDRFEIR